MLLIKTKIGPSEIEGIGCFADEFIPEGAAIWRFQEGFDLEIPRDEVEKLSPSGKYQFLKYSYLTGSEIYVLCFDDARFFNHSENPNVIGRYDGGRWVDVATRDIKKGEELVCDYRKFDKDFARKLGVHK